jgi:hypothetical protein
MAFGGRLNMQLTVTRPWGRKAFVLHVAMN